MLKRALSVGKQRWSPNSVTLAACLDYLEGQGDVGGTEDMIRLLKKLGPLTRDIYHRWLNICVATGASVSEVLDHMKMDGVSKVSTFCGGFYTSTSHSDPADTIYRRISKAGHPTNSMAAILDQWLEQGRDLKQSDLQGLVKMLRRYNRSGHALQMAKSVEAMKKAILADRPGWKPNTITLAAILEYLKQQDDVGAAEEEFLKLLQERGHSSTSIYDKLGSNFNKETLHFEAIDQMEREDTLVDGEMHEIIKNESSS
ncbi:hypothetical protein QYF36_011533 [Acer negundo]|nr:hypothetical protein QYF36_011533 [Acer negundo]